MLRVENVRVVGLEPAIRGMRNPMNSWLKSDSHRVIHTDEAIDGQELLWDYFIVGEADRKLMRKLVDAGPEHRKFMRMVVCYMDITAPLYWWKEFDTYKVGTVTDSCSTMHTITKRDLTLDDFSTEHLSFNNLQFLNDMVKLINRQITKFRESGDKDDWWQVIQLLPSSFNQRRTVMLSYEAVRSMYHQRQGHKLDEWLYLRKEFERLPEFQTLIA